MENLADWRFVVGGLVAAFVIGLSRGGFAGGVAFIGVLIMAQLVPPVIAAAFILPLLCFIDPFGNYIYRKHVHWPSVKILLPGGLVGIGVGTAVFYLVDDNVMRIILAFLSVYMVIDLLVSHKRHATPHTYPRAVGYVLGFFAGLSTFIIHAGHPPVSAYLLPQHMSRFLFMGTFAVLFTTFNYVKLLPYAWLGLLDWSLLSVSVVFFPICIAGFLVGKWLVPRMSDRVFYMIMYASVLLLGIKLGIESVVELVG